MSGWKYEQRGNTFNDGRPIRKQKWRGPSRYSGEEADFEKEQFYESLIMDDMEMGGGDFDEYEGVLGRRYGQDVGQRWQDHEWVGPDPRAQMVMPNPSRNPRRDGGMNISDPGIRAATIRALREGY